MKKLKLNLSNIENAEILSREQLKNILGGSDTGFGENKCCCTCSVSSTEARCKTSYISNKETSCTGICYSACGSGYSGVSTSLKKASEQCDWSHTRCI